jgi:hypothetical protein
VTWALLADVIVPPWALGLSMPARDKVLVARYAAQQRHPSTACESCGGPGEVHMPDGSRWCSPCDTAAAQYEPRRRHLRLVQ